jgi:hypothetical protein
MVRTYDPKKIAIIVGGVPLSGFADGTMVKASRSVDTFSKKSGVDGIITRTHHHDRSGEITVSLNQSSPSNDYLSAIAKVDEESNAGVVPVLIKDALPATGSVGSTFVAAKAWIRKPPDAEYGDESTNRDWVFDVDDFEIFLGGNLAA